MEDRILVLQPGLQPVVQPVLLRAVPLRWESQVQDTGLQQTSKPHVISNSENLPEISISKSRPSSTQNPSSSSTGHPMPNNYQDRNTPHPLAQRLPKIIIRPQTPQNTPPDVDLPNRKTRSSLIHQNTGTSPLHQEAQTTHWTTLRQTPKTTGTTNPQPGKRRHQTE